MELPPEPAPLSSQALAASSHRDILAGEPAADEINGRDVCSNASDILVPPCIREVPRQNLAAGRLDFNLPNRLVSSTLESEIEATDAGEQ